MVKNKLHEGLIDKFLTAIYASALKGKVGEIDKAIKQIHDKLTDDDKKKIIAAIESADKLLKSKINKEL